MTTSYVASYDFGTSGVKATLVDTDGNVRSTATENYALLSPQPGWAEQEPEAYWTACCKATRNAMAQIGAEPSQVKGIAFGTHWKGVIPVDHQDRVLYNNIIWLDKRSGKQAEELNKKLGTKFTSIDYWPRLMWLREHMPDIYQNAAYFLDLNAFLKFKATGKKAVDATNHFFAATRESLQAEYDRIVKAAELDPDKIPPLVLPTDLVGELTAQAAAELGLREGTPVFGGCSDIPAVAIGSGGSSKGSCHIYLGSSGWLGVMVPERREGVGDLVSSFLGDRDVVLYAMASACMSYNWAIEQFYHEERKTAGDGIYSVMDRELRGVEAGSGRLIAIPWIHGEIRNEHAKAVFFNVSHEHDRRHFVSAVLEGICYTLRWKADAYREQTGNAIPEIRVVGGGACSAPWMQRLADILQIPVHIPKTPRHAGAIGTAYCALIGLGICESFEEADRRITVEQTFMPNEENAAMYDRLYSVFRSLIPVLDEPFAKLNGSYGN